MPRGFPPDRKSLEPLPTNPKPKAPRTPKRKAPRVYEEHEIGPQHIGRTVHVKNVGKVHVSGVRPSGEAMYHIIEPAMRDAGSYEDFKTKHGLSKDAGRSAFDEPQQLRPRQPNDRRQGPPKPYTPQDMNWAKNFRRFEQERLQFY